MRKTAFLRGDLGSSSLIWYWHLVQPWNFKSVCQNIQIKNQKVLGLTPTFVEVTGEKLVGGAFVSPHPE